MSLNIASLCQSIYLEAWFSTLWIRKHFICFSSKALWFWKAAKIVCFTWDTFLSHFLFHVAPNPCLCCCIMKILVLTYWSFIISPVVNGAKTINKQESFLFSGQNMLRWDNDNYFNKNAWKYLFECLYEKKRTSRLSDVVQ